MITSPIPDSLFDLCDQFNDFGLDDLKPKPVRSPPPEYLCHLCFKKGHYIRDCPQVKLINLNTILRMRIHFYIILHFFIDHTRKFERKSCK